MNTTPKHTPTPCKLSHHPGMIKVVRDISNDGIQTLVDVLCEIPETWTGAEEKANKIVRAVNTYEEHVHLLKMASEEIVRVKGHSCWKLCDEIAAAIRKAEGR